MLAIRGVGVMALEATVPADAVRQLVRSACRLVGYDPGRDGDDSITEDHQDRGEQSAGQVVDEWVR